MPRTKLTAGQLHDFGKNPVWVEISERISALADQSRNAAIDYSEPREAGKCRAYELVLGLPQLLLGESEGKGMVSKIIKFTR